MVLEKQLLARTAVRLIMQGKRRCVRFDTNWGRQRESENHIALEPQPLLAARTEQGPLWVRGRRMLMRASPRL